MKINTALKEIAKEKGITCIDLYSHFVNASGGMIKNYTWDGVHLTQEEYIEWIRILKKGHYLE